MNIAWGTAAILALLLPGFFFLRGLGLAEPFSRDATPRSPIALLALTVLMSLLAHAAGVSLLHRFGPYEADFKAVLLVASGQLTTEDHVDCVAAAVGRYPGPIAAYFAAVSLSSLLFAGLLGLWATNWSALGRIFYEHEWLHDYHRKSRPALVYALTNIEFEKSLVMYHGELDRLGIKQDGRFSFIVLKGARRAVLPGHKAEAKFVWRPVQPRLAGGARLYLDGESITNLLLDPVPNLPTAGPRKEFLAKAMKEIELAASGLLREERRLPLIERLVLAAEELVQQILMRFKR